MTERSRSKKKEHKSDRKKSEQKLEQTTSESRIGRHSKVRRSRSDSPRKSGRDGFSSSFIYLFMFFFIIILHVFASSV